VSRARLNTERRREYEIVRISEHGEWMLSDEHHEIRLFDSSASREFVEVRCDFCGRWSTDAAPVAVGDWSSWKCGGGAGPCPRMRRAPGGNAAERAWVHRSAI